MEKRVHFDLQLFQLPLSDRSKPQAYATRPKVSMGRGRELLHALNTNFSFLYRFSSFGGSLTFYRIMKYKKAVVRKNDGISKSYDISNPCYEHVAFFSR